jgi:hypothetical protein
MRQNEQNRQQDQAYEQQVQNQQAAASQGISEYNRAFGACLEAKGYTVK